jgi:Ca2+-binding RTX toxin-like protein
MTVVRAGRPVKAGRRIGGAGMRRTAMFLWTTLLLLGTVLVGTAAAQQPLCGPPGEEQPATIVGSGRIIGTNGDDVIVGSARRDSIFGLGGNDIICGEGGNDRLFGEQGDDFLIGDNVNLPPFIESDGNNDDELDGGPGDDTLAGLGGDDELLGGPGNDEIIGFGGYDHIEGGPGDDTAFGGPLDDDVSGGRGNDTLWGNFGSDDIEGGAGDDFIDGDNPFPPPPELPFPPGTNDDDCRGGPGVDVVQNCETSRP